MIVAYKLTIKKADQSIYWVEMFKTEEAALEWLTAEQSRSYWKTEYTYEITPIAGVLRST